MTINGRYTKEEINTGSRGTTRMTLKGKTVSKYNKKLGQQ
jgi:hypothetical protein